MNDHKLLKLAAKADGHTFPWFFAKEGAMHEWNPLTDDGDALRLAVKLRIDVGYHDTNGHVRAHPRHGYILFTSEDYHAHPTIEAATRHAITRAAAEIGKAMP